MTPIQALSRDKVLRPILEKYGELPPINLTTDIFLDLLSTIVGQQLSTKAADTIWKRFELLFVDKKITADTVIALSDQAIRDVGVSFPKIKYMKGLAGLVVDNQLDLAGLQYMDDSKVIEELTKIKGIGVWSAEMILMFSLARADVFSIGDLGLRNAVSKLYGVDRDDLPKILEISKQWAPFRTTASRYLWRSLDNAPVSSS